MSLTIPTSSHEPQETRGVYTRLIEHQTRLLELCGDLGNPKSQLVCDLHVVDLLRSDFGAGLGFRDTTDTRRGGRLVEYSALSYYWGTGTANRQLQCRGVHFPIMENLHEAMTELRYSGNVSRWLWVDAICINQQDNDDKALQIPQMIYIYQQATQVISWLGGGGLDISQLSLAAAIETTPDRDWIQRRRSSYDTRTRPPTSRLPLDNLEAVCKALSALYSKPYFRRMWVQQEVFAAERLEFRSLEGELYWSGAIVDPYYLMPIYGLGTLEMTEETLSRLCADWGVPPQTLSKLVRVRRPKRDGFLSRVRLALSGQKGKKSAIEAIDVDDETLARLHHILKVCILFDKHVRCFAQIRDRADDKDSIEIVEALLYTGQLEATNGRDRIYGLLAMVGFPSSPVMLEEWARRGLNQQRLIPVDYTMSERTLQLIVMRILIFEGGLGLLAKFKMLLDEDVQSNVGDSNVAPLPSWVVDWQLASTVFHRRPADTLSDYNLHRSKGLAELHDAWHWWGRAAVPNPVRGHGFLPARSFLDEGPVLIPHKRMCADNDRALLTGEVLRCLEQLIVRGTIEHRFVLRGRQVLANDSCFSESGSQLPKNGTVIWNLGVNTEMTDIIIWPEAFVGPAFATIWKGRWEKPFNLRCWQNHGMQAGLSPGLWLLSRSSNGSYRLKAVLICTMQDIPIYRLWDYRPPADSQIQRSYRRLLVSPEHDMTFFEEDKSRDQPCERFIIV